MSTFFGLVFGVVACGAAHVLPSRRSDEVGCLENIKGMAKEEAMQKYVDLLAKDDPAWESHPVLADWKPE